MVQFIYHLSCIIIDTFPQDRRECQAVGSEMMVIRTRIILFSIPLCLDLPIEGILLKRSLPGLPYHAESTFCGTTVPGDHSRVSLRQCPPLFKYPGFHDVRDRFVCSRTE